LRGKPSLASSLADITGIFAFKQLFQWLTGGRVAPRLVSIGHLRRDDILPFLHLFSTPVIAEGSVYYLEYAPADLRHHVVASPGAFAQFFEYFPCAVYTPGEMPLANQVSSLLSAAMRQAVPMPALVQVAAQLGVPASTLRLKLEQSGTSYRALRDQCQYEAALVLLADSALSTGDIADQLGFRTAATFRRAFRRWSGAPPSHFRPGGAARQVHSGADAAI
jgi:AraC-like DNA-binding protein